LPAEHNDIASDTAAVLYTHHPGTHCAARWAGDTPRVRACAVATLQGLERSDSGHLGSGGSTPAPGSPVAPPTGGAAGSRGAFGGIPAELGTLEREPAVQAAVGVPNERRRSGEASWQRQRHRLAEQGSSLDGAAPEWPLTAGTGGNTEAAQPAVDAAEVSITPPGLATVSSDDPAAAAAAAAASTAAGGGDAADQDPHLPDQPIAAGPQLQSPAAGDAEVPSFIEDALGRRAELDTAAALGSTDMSSGDLVQFSFCCVHVRLSGHLHNNTSREVQVCLLLILQAVLSGDLGGVSSPQDTGTDISHAASGQLLSMPESAGGPAAAGGNGTAVEDPSNGDAAHQQRSSADENGERGSTGRHVEDHPPAEAGASGKH
jgi:hypothetical protein